MDLNLKKTKKLLFWGCDRFIVGLRAMLHLLKDVDTFVTSQPRTTALDIKTTFVEDRLFSRASVIT